MDEKRTREKDTTWWDRIERAQPHERPLSTLIAVDRGHCGSDSDRSKTSETSPMTSDDDFSEEPEDGLRTPASAAFIIPAVRTHKSLSWPSLQSNVALAPQQKPSPTKETLLEPLPLPGLRTPLAPSRETSAPLISGSCPWWTRKVTFGEGGPSWRPLQSAPRSMSAFDQSAHET
ncbi:uncharacterized protein PHACADRAFT_182906 [Phanerochaete carnosa HHB-10118-sp]|uniref:Uncharacterized protein n=1 Tax=Phanerochaete carnosa (strain HHB-10118-sp) TaxID=650164 RepID=K5WH03_PHACS|nr:uncharacterized protein PHACADRAFT_182906 [Phanerochaete carnosa HHB-10118-sp]EKM58610.1 hypothetical protein PHACADRAFT_182906 [Phanerochaete carnosa HHB-10118-sp]